MPKTTLSPGERLQRAQAETQRADMWKAIGTKIDAIVAVAKSPRTEDNALAKMCAMVIMSEHGFRQSESDSGSYPGMFEELWIAAQEAVETYGKGDHAAAMKSLTVIIKQMKAFREADIAKHNEEATKEALAVTPGTLVDGQGRAL